jgi:uncharacterized protein YyaL (SSP411 family)
MEFSREQIKYFWDESKGGLFFYGNDGEQLLTRPKEVYDGAMPSGNSVALLNFLRLSRLTGAADLEDKAQTMITAFANTVSSGPTAHSFFLSGLLFYLRPSREVVVVGHAMDGQVEKMLGSVQKAFLPDTVVLYKDAHSSELELLAPFTRDMTVQNGNATAYVCEGFACQEPVADVEFLRQIISSSRRQA